MWIQTNTTTRELQLPWMDEPVSFNQSGTAQVPREVGDRLIDELDAVSEYNQDQS